MHTSTILFMVASVLVTATAAAIGFFAGRASVPDDHAPVISERTEAATTTFPRYAFPVADETTPADLRAQLLDALERPAAERNRAIRVAMNAWLAVDGAAAIMAVRDDPELGEVANRMTHFALFAYPELFVDDRSLLEGIPDAGQSIRIAARAMAMFDPDAARGMIDTGLSGSTFGRAVLSAADRIERAEQDPYAELESIVAERDRSNQIPRLFELVVRVAAEDPVAAAELIDDLPAPLMEYAIQALVEIWSRADPEEAARWLAQKNAQVSGEGLSRLANGWGQSDFEAANAFADTLTGRKRAVFLTGLVSATGRLSNDELLAWVSRYEDDPAYPNLIMSATGRLSNDELLAWVSRYEDDPAYPNLIMSVAQRLAQEDIGAAVALIDEIGNESVRGQLVPMVSGMWAQNDAESALDWALGLSSGRTRDRAIASIAPSLMDLDMELDLDRAIDVINEIEDPELRRRPVRALLHTVESDEEAIRLGRDYGFDRDAVLELRENRGRMYDPGLVRSISKTFHFVRPGAGTDEE